MLAIAGLSACRTNVGVAATVQGHKISESDVTRYVSVKAQPVSVSDASGGSSTIAPRTFVVEILVYNQLLQDVLASTPDGGPSTGELAQLRTQVLAGKTPAQLATSQGVKGYTSALHTELVRRLTYTAALSAYQQKGVDVSALAKKLHVRVSLSPRYGTWDAANLSIDTRPGAGVPAFVTLQPTAASSSQPIAVASP